MTIIEYLESYQNKSFKEMPFNEIDAAILSLLAYFPFDQISNKKNVIKHEIISSYIKQYTIEENDPETKGDNIKTMELVLESKRYKKIRFSNFEKRISSDLIEQFQAVTIELKKFVYVSFSGTDSSILGWREDFNMAYLDMVPSEIDAVKYANKIRKKHPFKKLYIGGHSKGGRLALRAGKELYKKNTLIGVYSFDGPNFKEAFYDKKYEEIKNITYQYAPYESVIGRLITDKKDKIIVDSNSSFIMQHNIYSWLIEGDHFIRKETFTDRSNKIANILIGVFKKYDNDTLSIFVNSLFDLLDRLNIIELKDADYNKQMFLGALSSVRVEWKKIPKENRKVITNILFTLLSLFIRKK